MRTYNVAADLKSAADSRSGGSGDPLEQDLLLASRNRGNHIVADEITWEQYILKKCPCRLVERCFSETQCSQVGVFEATWEQYVPDNRPYKLSQGRFSKTYRSQVFLSAAVTCGLCKSWGAGGCDCYSGGCSRIPRLSSGTILQPPHNFRHRRRFDGGIRRDPREKLLDEYIRRHY